MAMKTYMVDEEVEVRGLVDYLHMGDSLGLTMGCLFITRRVGVSSYNGCVSEEWGKEALAFCTGGNMRSLPA